ncbi:hypothetical protein R1sor_007127 [Riccia sorocarpa]|uniref:Reverse transcriptase zinc-binding domain-containing protein n=1 Tax=Riccia sorocarpa TaxID=122646 RepID=A0ABD3HTP1_9MARC
MGDSMNDRLWRLLGDGRNKLLQSNRSPVRNTVPRVNLKIKPRASQPAVHEAATVPSTGLEGFQKAFQPHARKELFGEVNFYGTRNNTQTGCGSQLLSFAFTYRAPKAGWSLQEILLLSSGMRINKAPVLTKLLVAWFRIKSSLRFEGTPLEIPTSMSYPQLEEIIKTATNTPAHHLSNARRWARKLKWKTVTDMLDAGGEWKNPEEELLRATMFPDEADKVALQHAWRPVWSSRPVSSESAQVSCWKWELEDQRVELHKITRSQLAKISASKTNLTSDNSLILPATKWRILWSLPTTWRTKIEIWKFLHHGHFTNSRARRMRVSDGLCLWCGDAVETTEHLFWHCRKLSLRKTWLFTFFEPSLQQSARQENRLTGTILEALFNTATALATIQVVASWIIAIWRDRNNYVFRGTRSLTPIPIILRHAVEELKAHTTVGMNETRARLCDNALRTLNEWFESTTLLRHNSPISAGDVRTRSSISIESNTSFSSGTPDSQSSEQSSQT